MTSTMDNTEKHVREHLIHCGYAHIEYEPDGNIPPDFLVAGNTAVEVRRLNQNYFSESEVKGLEEVAISLWNRMSKLLASFGPPSRGSSWYVYYRFSRPIGAWTSIEQTIRAGLQDFVVDANHSKRIVARAQGIEVEVIAEKMQPHKSMFVIAGCSDQDSGGWLLAEMEANIRYCASEKSRKVQQFRPNYEHWWLALVDHIGYGLDNLDCEMFRDQVSVDHNWDKILVIDPNDHKRWLEI